MQAWAAGLMQGDHVGFGDVLRVDVLAGLDACQGADPIAVDGGFLIGQGAAGALHLGHQFALDRLALAGEKGARLIDQTVIGHVTDPLDAWGAAAFDLEQQAGTRPAGETRCRHRTAGERPAADVTKSD